MASKASSVFDSSDRNLFRLRKMSEVVSTKAVRQLLRWLNPKWMPSMSFKEYLKTEKKVSMKAFNNILKTPQKVAIRTDPQGDNHDISLLYILLLWVNEGLADKDDDVWKKKSGRLEYLITSVKDIRNNLMHGKMSIDGKKFHERTEALRDLLKDMISSAGSVCKHISQTEVDQTIQDVNDLINKIRDDPLEPKDFEEYKKQLMFPKQCDFVKKKGAWALRIRHGKYSSLTPVSRLAKVIFPVEDVFTEMLLERGSGKKKKLDLQDILEEEDQSITDDVMLVEGDAGVGKTTLTKKLLSVWTTKTGIIKHLESYDLVLHAECREHVESFKGLLESSMPEVCQSFQGEDVTFVALSLNILIIVDGFDELNRESTRLFKEILQLQKDYGITVIVTSRPEAVEKYFQLTRSHHIETKHIRLLGIPLEKREDFVKKYYDGIEKTGLSNQGIDGLLNYLKRTEHRLSRLWRLPYNLTIVTILWTLKPDIVNCITTAPELHWEIHQLSLSKLMDRLLDNELTQHLPSSVLMRKTDHFIYMLCRESLVALVNDEITLSEDAYHRLESICIEEEIPVEEMTGAFLKKTITISGIRYALPHKGLQDFLAALFIWIRLTATPMSADVLKIVKGVIDVLSKNEVPLHVNQNIVKFSTEALKRAHIPITIQKCQNFDSRKVEEMIESVLDLNFVPVDMSQDICRFINERFNRNPQASEPSSTGTLITDSAITRIIQEEIGKYALLNDTSKFQNMLISLIGIFYRDSSRPIENDTKMGVLLLLQQSGVRDKDAWLNILNSVKCDAFVASFICKQPSILEGDITITDSTLFAYISLFQALKPPLEGASEVGIVVDIKGDLTGVSELMKLISIHQFREKTFVITDGNFMEFTTLLESLKIPVKNPSEINLDVRINNNFLRIAELLKQTRRNNFTVALLKTYQLKIHDANLKESISVLQFLPQLSGDANQVSVDIDVKGDFEGGDELLMLLDTNQFKVKKIVITDDNFLKYTTVLKSRTSLLKDAHEVQIDVHIDEDISAIRELLIEIKRNHFVVKRLDVKKTDFLINDSNVVEYTAKLKDLPIFLEDAYDGVIELNVKEETPEVLQLLKEIGRIKIGVKINRPQEFMFPTSQSLMENLLKKVFDSCVTTMYVGTLGSIYGVSLPRTLKELCISVNDTDNRICLQILTRYLHENRMAKLSLCLHRKVHTNFDVEIVVPPETPLVDLYLPDVTSLEDIKYASRMTGQVTVCQKKGYISFERLYFPRARLNPEHMAHLIQLISIRCNFYMRVSTGLVFPTSCMPEKLEDRKRLDDLSKEYLHTSNVIDWNQEVGSNSIFEDLSKWEQEQIR